MGTTGGDSSGRITANVAIFIIASGHRPASGSDGLCWASPSPTDLNASLTLPRSFRPLSLALLTREAFRRFGDVLDASGSPDEVANAGAAKIWRDRAEVDFAGRGGRICFNVVRTAAQRLPLEIGLMERHPLSAQTFAPLAAAEWLVIVAPAGALDPEAVVAFRVRPGQAVNYRRGVWHCPLVALERESDFLVIDRAGEGANLDVERLATPFVVGTLET